MTAGDGQVRFYVDGISAGGGSLEISRADEGRLPIKIGYCNDNFPDSRQGFTGLIDDVYWYDYELSESMIQKIVADILTSYAVDHP